MAIRAQDVLQSGKRSHHRKQARLRKVKVREQLVYDAETLAGVNEYFCFGSSRSKRSRTPGAFLGGILKRTHDRGPDGQYGTILHSRTLDCGYGLLEDLIRLGVYLVIFQTLGANRLKGAKSHIESDLRDFDSAIPQQAQNPGREMQAGGGRRNRASLPSKHGLVALTVGRLVFTLDVGRQRYVAEARESLIEVTR
jgi:hypothetical protein